MCGFGSRLRWANETMYELVPLFAICNFHSYYWISGINKLVYYLLIRKESRTWSYEHLKMKRLQMPNAACSVVSFFLLTSLTLLTCIAAVARCRPLLLMYRSQSVYWFVFVLTHWWALQKLMNWIEMFGFGSRLRSASEIMYQISDGGAHPHGNGQVFGCTGL